MVGRRPIVVVTGANSGVGYASCERLITQLCSESPPDRRALAKWDSLDARIDTGQFEGLTLVLACRSTKRAEEAKEKLLAHLDSEVERTGATQTEKHKKKAIKFKENVSIDVQYLDLASMDTIFKFAEEINARYPYISHLICNAGIASFIRIDFLLVIKQVFTEPMVAITNPAFNVQAVGERGIDGLGYVWQCNTFGHYALVKLLSSSLTSSKYPEPARVIWVSSMEATPKHWDPDDYQLLKTVDSYGCSKYEIDLIASELDKRALASGLPTETSVRHFISQPGVFSSKISSALVGPVLDALKVILFYIGRWCGSPHHTITAFNAAIASIHLCLISLPFITPSSASKINGVLNDAASSEGRSRDRPVRYGSETDFWGHQRVGVTEVVEWEKYKDYAPKLVDYCEHTLERFMGYRNEPRELRYESATELM